ncbi:MULTISPECIES: SDR family NAD(P)-dependent oxidoreductase [Haloferax]|uniref:Short-chain family oxidoreductase n=4 Tax=Haloferax volcanii TaxID=2246 RepID=A0A384KJF5_HALVD|nr:MULTISPECIES: glucose 1-dehydrogenase [Haloferax]ADE01879.1 putative oxidoreductase (short-chain dehydrogenase family) [Haloferax volcanii DS2]ELK50899.1 short-chain family oxidoreductase [Haloferax sp. BAB-2207]ELY37541.1 short-chain family oxidoreductase [Haloferax volcanii DS2]ELZ89681.1 short-chain family oxidoreductase [Haloferax alexandrinus JCM 10717]MBS8120847.1 glucose 1-dehydrogenase [Haloferax volcanii]
MADRLDGKTAVVTGASSGIGRASATRLAAEGANVVLGDIDAERGREVVSEIEADGGDATFVAVDVTDADDVRSMVETARETYGGLDIAHNNAGIEGDNDPLPEQSRENWDRVLGINLTGVWLAMKHELPALMEGDGGAIINTSSIAGLAADGSEPYVASKHGVVGLTKSAAVRYAEEGVRVNAVCPGVVRTPMVERSLEANPGAVEAITAEQPLGRMAEPEEIASAVAWLASEDASFVNGHALPVDGGKLA